MIIAVDDTLSDIAKELKSKGYKIISTSESKKKVDAIVYSDPKHMMDSDMESAGELGIFLVDGKGKTSEEIDIMLKKRCYSSLFDH